MAVLVRNGRHMRPMLAVITRYGIGSEDKYGRGRWISERDLPVIRNGMLSDRSGFSYGDDVAVQGTNQHNYVMFHEFERLFRE